MKTISLLQPWATLVAIGEKTIETRSWRTNYRGPLAIHASLGTKYINVKSKYYLCGTDPFYSVIMVYAHKQYRMYRDIAGLPNKPMFPLGAIIATCELTNCVRIPYKPQPFPSDDRINKSYCQMFQLIPPPLERGHELSFGDYTPGRYAWILSNIKPLVKPVPVKGSLGLWEWNAPDGIS
jgi:hypothetical protein